MDLRNVDEDWLIKELRKKLPSFDYPPEHRKLVEYANSLTSPESQGEMMNAMFGVTAPVGDLTKLAIGHSNLKSVSMQALEDALNSRRAVNIDKKLPFDTSTGSVRDEIARRNAVDMLGLPETNTALDRANAMGYTQNAFHGSPGTGKNHIEFFGSAEHRGRATGAKSAEIADWASDSPVVANSYSNVTVSPPDNVIEYSNKQILPLRVKDATTFNPKQSNALSKLNELINKNNKEKEAVVEKLSKMPSYQRFVDYAKTNWGKDYFKDTHPVDAINSMKDNYLRVRDNPKDTFSNNIYKDVGYDALYRDIEKDPNLIHSMIPPNYSKYTRQIPTVYDSKGRDFSEIPKGMTYKLNNAPEGTEVFRFHNLVDPEPASTHYAIMKPNAVRSRFAAFDPARRNSSDILAGVAAGSLSLQALLDLLNEDQYR